MSAPRRIIYIPFFLIDTKNPNLIFREIYLDASRLLPRHSIYLSSCTWVESFFTPIIRETCLCILTPCQFYLWGEAELLGHKGLWWLLSSSSSSCLFTFRRMSFLVPGPDLNDYFIIIIILCMYVLCLSIQWSLILYFPGNSSPSLAVRNLIPLLLFTVYCTKDQFGYGPHPIYNIYMNLIQNYSARAKKKGSRWFWYAVQQ
jgi:hypothetical protein